MLTEIDRRREILVHIAKIHEYVFSVSHFSSRTDIRTDETEIVLLFGTEKTRQNHEP
jgi:hypothetical protein